MLALKNYSGSDSDDAPPAKKRKLPPLSPRLVTASPVDNPADHQGRKRTTPFVQGQYASYVYLATQAPASFLNPILGSAAREVPTLRYVPSNELCVHALADSTRVELHVSLTRPTFLRSHQREQFRHAVQTLARQHARFRASFATLVALTNDERTRQFLALEIGAGHSQMKALSDGLAPTLQSIRQKEFYTSPRFHSSIAWALLEPSSPKGIDVLDAPSEEIRGESVPRFETIPHFPPTLLSELNSQFDTVYPFDVDYIYVKIGKDVTRWRLSD